MHESVVKHEVKSWKRTKRDGYTYGGQVNENGAEQGLGIYICEKEGY